MLNKCGSNTKMSKQFKKSTGAGSVIQTELMGWNGKKYIYFVKEEWMGWEEKEVSCEWN